jgi:pyridoxal phosphate enzyme (YggS family)
MEAAETAEIKQRLEAAHQRIQEACANCGRNPSEVRLLLATKTQPAEVVAAALAAGEKLVGENRVQELVAKGPELAAWEHSAHLIGPLQTNKINAALRWADCIQTVDSLRLAERIAARTQTPVAVMVQVNTSGESTKSGVAPAAAEILAYEVAALKGLKLTGFMTVGPNVKDPVVIGRAYATLRGIRDRVRESGQPGVTHAQELSMGMSGDLEIAVAEGATIVRLGSAVFGARL